MVVIRVTAYGYGLVGFMVRVSFLLWLRLGTRQLHCSAWRYRVCL